MYCNNNVSTFRYGNHDSMEYKLILAEYPSIPQIVEDVEYIQVEGRREPYQIKKGTYKRGNISLKVRLIEDDAMWDYIESIQKWLFAKYKREYRRLYFDREDRYFIVREVQLGDITKEIKMYGEFTITFVVEAFMMDGRYHDVRVLNNNVEYKTKVLGDFEPELKVNINNGKGNISIEINDRVTTIENCNGNIELDDIKCIDTSNNLDKSIDASGNILYLDEGLNTIVCKGEFNEIVISYYNRYR